MMQFTFTSKLVMSVLRLIVVLVLGCIAVGLEAQSLQRLHKKALRAYEANDLEQALAYTDAILKEKEDPTLLYRAGLAAFDVRDYRSAIAYLRRIPFSDRKGELAYTDYFLAMSYKGFGEYDRAIAQLDRFQKTNPQASEELRVKDELEHCRWAREQLYFPVKIKIKNAGLTVNTADDDLSPLMYADKLYYSTKRGNAAKLYSRITGFYAKPARENPDSKEGSIENIALTADAQTMFFNICDLETGECSLYSREKNYEGEWGVPKKLPRHINLSGYTAEQPAVGYDRTLKRNVLYFVSDRPGGKGGLDIWASIIEKDGSYGEPFPLPFNTDQDEITPYFHQASQTLFFSSMGLTGFGGFDIFKCKKMTAESWSEPQNLGNPLNSSFDECYFTFHTSTKQAFFSSNRPGGVNDGSKRGLPSFDVYEAQVFVELKPRILDAVYDFQICKATVVMEELITGELKTYQLKGNCDEVAIPLDLERIYTITIEVDDHLPVTIHLNTLGVNFTRLFEPEVKVQPDDAAYLAPKPNAVVKP
jgi:tetratricopeptide (TPR) repeat protein